MSEYAINSLSRRYASLDVSPQLSGYSGIRVDPGDGSDPFLVGTESGRVITVNNPWMTQAQAERALAKLQGFAYQPFSAVDALLSPAAELGDGVVLNGLFSGIYAIERDYNALMAAGIRAPQDEEIDHEYPYEPQAERSASRRFSAIESELLFYNDRIEAKVSQTGGNNSSFGWSLLSDHFSLFSGSSEVFRVDRNGAKVTGTITATAGAIGPFTINANNSKAIQYNGATYGGNRTGLYLGSSGLQLGAANGAYFQCSMKGDVVAHNMKLTGTLNVGGSNITAASLRTGAAHGNSYGTATSSSSPPSYPTYFTAKYLYATENLGAKYVDVEQRLTCGFLTVGGRGAGWMKMSYNGSTYWIMNGGYAS